MKFTRPKPTPEQLSTWKRRHKLLRKKALGKTLKEGNRWVLYFSKTVQKALTEEKMLSPKQQYWLAHYAGERDMYLKEEESAEDKKLREINEHLAFQAEMERDNEQCAADAYEHLCNFGDDK